MAVDGEDIGVKMVINGVREAQGRSRVVRPGSQASILCMAAAEQDSLTIDSGGHGFVVGTFKRLVSL